MPGTCSCGKPAYSASQYMCRSCHAAYAREWRKTHPKTERQRQNHIARRTATNHKRDGKLVPQPCAQCGSKEKLEMHHDDYNRPLDVTWLCRKCHIDFHREHKRLIEAEYHIEIREIGA